MTQTDSRMNGKDLQDYLSGFSGTENWYLDWIGGMLYTDGIKAMAEKVGAYWLIDAIASYGTKMGLRERYPFQLWTLDVRGTSGVLTMREDIGKAPVVTQEFRPTEFPEGSWKFYLIDDGTNQTLILPGEY